MPLKTCTPSDVTPLTRPEAVSTTGEFGGLSGALRQRVDITGHGAFSRFADRSLRVLLDGVNVCWSPSLSPEVAAKRPEGSWATVMVGH